MDTLQALIDFTYLSLFLFPHTTIWHVAFFEYQNFIGIIFNLSGTLKFVRAINSSLTMIMRLIIYGEREQTTIFEYTFAT